MTTHGYEDYRRAAEVLWGDAGAFLVDEQQRMNADYFDGELPPLPVVIGITAYGKCIGVTRPEMYTGVPRITIASNLFKRGAQPVADTLVHEMVHAKLQLAGVTSVGSQHIRPEWCAEITRITPLLLGCEIKATPPKSVRTKDGAVIKRTPDGHLTRDELARWPHSLREDGYHGGRALRVASY